MYRTVRVYSVDPETKTASISIDEVAVRVSLATLERLRSLRIRNSFYEQKEATA